MTDLAARAGQARRLGAAALRLPLPARRQGHPADGRGAGPPLPRHPVPACEPEGAARDAAPGQRRQGARSASAAGASRSPTSRSARPSSSASPARPRRISQYLLDWLEEAQLDRVGAFKFEPVEGAAANAHARPGARGGQAGALRARDGAVRAHLAPRSSRAKVGSTIEVLIDARRCRNRRRHRPLQGRRARDRRRGPPARRRRAQARRHRLASAIEDSRRARPVRRPGLNDVARPVQSARRVVQSGLTSVRMAHRRFTQRLASGWRTSRFRPMLCGE